MSSESGFRRILLGIDLGSSSTKAILYDSDSRRILSRTRVRITTKSHARSGCLFVEHDPLEILKSAQEAAATVLQKLPRGASVAAGLASQRSSFLLVERRSLKPLTPVLSWQDTRGLALMPNLSRLAPEIYRRTGLYLTPYYSLTKLLWLLKQHPQWPAKAKAGEILYCPIPTYLALTWSRGRVFAIDPTLAQRSLLMNLQTCRWDETLLKKLDIPRAMLPEIKQTNDDYGSFFVGSLPLSLVSMIGDQQAAFLALAQKKPKDALINLGTGGFLLIPTGARPARVKGLLSGIRHCLKNKPFYLLEGTVNSIQGTLKWMEGLGILRAQDRIQIPKMPSKEFMQRIPVASGGFGGLAAPFWRTDVRVTVSGLDRTTTRKELAAGFIFGIAHMFWEILRPLRASAYAPKRLIASGGLSSSRGFLEVLANYLELPIQPADDMDLTALGACAAASAQSLRLPIRLKPSVKPKKNLQKTLDLYRQKAHQELMRQLAI